MTSQAHVEQVSAGEKHSLALLDSGKVYSFGYGGSGQLGHGDDEDQSLPRQSAA